MSTTYTVVVKDRRFSATGTVYHFDTKAEMDVFLDTWPGSKALLLGTGNTVVGAQVVRA